MKSSFQFLLLFLAAEFPFESIVRAISQKGNPYQQAVIIRAKIRRRQRLLLTQQITQNLRKLSRNPYACPGATKQDIEGPFYIANAPFRGQYPICSDFRRAPLQIVGKVIDENCLYPIQANIDVWQPSFNGNYSGLMPNLRPKDPYSMILSYSDYDCRGKIKTDLLGNYLFTTVYPGLYPGRPRHIHVKVTAPGYEPLTTQIYFKEDDTRSVYQWNSAAIQTVMSTCGGCDVESCRNAFYMQVEGCFGCSEPTQLVNCAKATHQNIDFRRGTFDIRLRQASKAPAETLPEPSNPALISPAVGVKFSKPMTVKQLKKLNEIFKTIPVTETSSYSSSSAYDEKEFIL